MEPPSVLPKPHFHAALPFALLCAILSGSAAGRGSLEVELRNTCMTPRSGAPITVDLDVSWSGATLGKGSFQFIVQERDRIAVRYRSPELVLRSGKQTFRLTLPPWQIPTYQRQLTARLSFITEDDEYPLPGQILLAPTAGEQSLVIGISDAWPGGRRPYLAILDGLQLGKLIPESLQPKTWPQPIKTWPTRVRPELFPVHPLGYCGFDIVLLVQEGFTFLDQDRLGALTQWVEAGGSLCVVPSKGQKQYHRSFLDRLRSRTVPFSKAVDLFDTRDGLTKSDVSLHRLGLGRVVVVQRVPTREQIGPPVWRNAAAFLWKVRASYVPSVVAAALPREVRARVPSLLQPEAEPSPVPLGGPAGDLVDSPYQGRYGRDAAWARYLAAEQLRSALMPQSVRLIPLWLIVLLLSALVVLIGPGDYFVLRALRARRLTWVTFPLTCVAFTGLTVGLAELYMGQEDHRSSVTVVDLDETGQALRSNRLDLRYSAKQAKSVHEVTDRLLVPVEQEYATWGFARMPAALATGRLRAEQVPLYAGRVPTRYEVTQLLRKWSPAITRKFGIRDLRPVHQLRWDRVGASNLGIRELWSRIPGLLFDGKPRGSVFLFHLLGEHCLYGKKTSFDLGLGDDSRRPRRHWYPSLAFLLVASAHPEKGPCSLVSQVSPAGGNSFFDDVPVFDTTDPNQWLLVVALREGNDHHMYRRLYCTDERMLNGG